MVLADVKVDNIYIEAPPGYDGTFYSDGMETVTRRYAIPQANRKMIEMCDYLIAYVTHLASNSWKFLEYARRHEKKGLIVSTER